MSLSAPVAGLCAKHPDVAAVDVCARCGTFLCGACVEYVRDGVAACTGCRAALALVDASWRARSVPLLALGADVLFYAVPFALRHRREGLWLLLGWVVAAGLTGVALVLARREEVAMAQARAAPAGRRWLRAGVVLMLPVLVPLALLLVGLVAVLLR